MNNEFLRKTKNGFLKTLIISIISIMMVFIMLPNKPKAHAISVGDEIYPGDTIDLPDVWILYELINEPSQPIQFIDKSGYLHHCDPWHGVGWDFCFFNGIEEWHIYVSSVETDETIGFKFISGSGTEEDPFHVAVIPKTDENIAHKFEHAVNNLPQIEDLTIDHKDIITGVKVKYNELTSAQKALVNEDVLGLYNSILDAFNEIEYNTAYGKKWFGEYSYDWAGGYFLEPSTNETIFIKNHFLMDIFNRGNNVWSFEFREASPNPQSYNFYITCEENDPTGLKVVDGSGTASDPYIFEPIYEERPSYVPVERVFVTQNGLLNIKFVVGRVIEVIPNYYPIHSTERDVTWSTSNGKIELYKDPECLVPLSSEKTFEGIVYAKCIETGESSIIVSSVNNPNLVYEYNVNIIETDSNYGKAWYLGQTVDIDQPYYFRANFEQIIQTSYGTRIEYNILQENIKDYVLAEINEFDSELHDWAFIFKKNIDDEFGYHFILRSDGSKPTGMIITSGSGSWLDPYYLDVLYGDAPHDHNYSSEWTYNKYNHWHVCEGEGVCTLPRGDLSSHNFVRVGGKSYVCSVCGYEPTDFVYIREKIQTKSYYDKQYIGEYFEITDIKDPNYDGFVIFPNSPVKISSKDGTLIGKIVLTMNLNDGTPNYNSSEGSILYEGDKVIIQDLSTNSITISSNSWSWAYVTEVEVFSTGIVSEVILNTNDGTINSGEITEYSKASGATLPSDVTKEDYIFAGWYDNSECLGERVLRIPEGCEGTKEFWAKWITLDSVLDGISSLPELDNITLSDRDFIVSLINSYNALPDEQKLQVPEVPMYKMLDASDKVATLEYEDASTKFNPVLELNTITISDKDIIMEAKEAYGALSSAAKGKVPKDTIDKLNDAIEEINDIEESNYVLGLFDLLPDKDSASIDDREAFEEARDAYNFLNDNQKAMVLDAYNAFTQAEDKVYDSVAQVVIDAINALPESQNIKYENKAQVEAVRALYDGLNSLEKAKISNTLLTTLVYAEMMVEKDSWIDILDFDFDTYKIVPVSDEDKALVRVDSNNIQATEYNATNRGFQWIIKPNGTNPNYIILNMNDPHDSDKVLDVAMWITNIIENARLTLTSNSSPREDDTDVWRISIRKDSSQGENEYYIRMVSADSYWFEPDDPSTIENAFKYKYVLTLRSDGTVDIGEYQEDDNAQLWKFVLVQGDEDIVKENIEAIGSVTYTPECMEKIHSARTMYNNLINDQKAILGTDIYNILKEAETLYASYAEENMNNLLNLDEITLENKGKVSELRSVYDSLTDEEKAHVSEDTVNKLLGLEVYVSIFMLPSVDTLALSDEEALTLARTKYNALTDAQKAFIPSAMTDKLTSLEEEIDDVKAAKEVIDLIDALPSINDTTLENEETINSAREAYEALSDNCKTKVSNEMLQMLESLEEKIQNIKIANEVSSLIASIGSVTYELSVRDTIHSVRSAYNALTDAQKALVGNLDVLNTAEETYAGFVSDEINNLFEDLTDISLDNKEDVLHLKDVYETLSDEEKAAVSPLALEKLNDALEEIKDIEKADEFNNTIDELPDAGDLTLEDKEKVESAREAYEELSDDAKEKVSEEDLLKLMMLEMAISSVEKVTELDNAIDSLPSPQDVTLEDKENVDKLLNNYNKLSPDAKALVSEDNIKKLEELKEAITLIEETNYKGEIQSVIDSINALPSIDDLSASDYASIRKIYDAIEELSHDQVSLIPSELISILGDKTEAIEPIVSEAQIGRRWYLGYAYDWLSGYCLDPSSYNKIVRDYKLASIEKVNGDNNIYRFGFYHLNYGSPSWTNFDLEVEENKNPTGLEIVSGSGSYDDPFVFGVIYDEAPEVLLDSITITPEADVLYVLNRVVKFTLDFSPMYTTERGIIWSVSNSNIILYKDRECTLPLDNNDLDVYTVYAKCVNLGDTTIKALSNDNETISYEYNVTVVETDPVWGLKWFIGYKHDNVKADYFTYLNVLSFYFFNGLTLESITQSEYNERIWMFNFKNSYNYTDYFSLLFEEGETRTPTGFMIKAGAGSHDDPYTLEPLFDDAPYVKLDAIDITFTSIQDDFYKGQVGRFHVSIDPVYASNKNVMWVLSNNNVELYQDKECTALVDGITLPNTVYVKAIEAGDTYISLVSTEDGSIYATYHLTIKDTIGLALYEYSLFDNTNNENWYESKIIIREKDTKKVEAILTITGDKEIEGEIDESTWGVKGNLFLGNDKEYEILWKEGYDGGFLDEYYSFTIKNITTDDVVASSSNSKAFDHNEVIKSFTASPVPVVRIDLSDEVISIFDNDQASITPQVNPGVIEDKTMTWSINKEDIIALYSDSTCTTPLDNVIESGMPLYVKGLKPGIATITFISVEDSTKKSYCVVKVKDSSIYTQVSYELIDSCSDGWNGAELIICLEGTTTPLYTLSITDGNAGKELGELTLIDGAKYDLHWVSGSYDSECSFKIKLGDDILIDSADITIEEGLLSNNITIGTLNENIDEVIVEEVKNYIDNLVDFSDLTLDEKKEIESIYKVYNELTDAQKNLISLDDVSKLNDSKNEIIDIEVSNEVIEEIDSLPNVSDITLDNKEEIEVARESYESLTDNQKAKVSQEVISALEALEQEITDIETSNEAIEDINALPKVSDVTLDNKEEIEVAREKYESLTDNQKAKVSQEVISALEALEQEITDIEVSNEVVEEIDSLPNVSDITFDNKEEIEAAKENYEALTDYQKTKVSQDVVELLETIVTELNDVEVAHDSEVAIESLPELEEITLENKEEILAVEIIYNELTEYQKAKLSSGSVAKLNAALKAINDIEASLSVKDLINEIGTVEFNDSSKEKIQAARNAYNSLTDAQKALISSEELKVLLDAEALYNELELSSQRHEIVDPESGLKIETSDQTGIPSNIELRVEVTGDIKEKDEIDLSSILKGALDRNEKISLIYDIKLVRVVNGVETIIQPSDIKDGMKIMIHITLNDEIIKKSFRLLHIHNNNDVEEITNYTLNGDELSFEIDRLSEFVFITPKHNTTPIALAVILLVLVILLFLFGIYVLYRLLKDQYNNKNEVKAMSISFMIPIIMLAKSGARGLMVSFFIILALTILLWTFILLIYLKRKGVVKWPFLDKIINLPFAKKFVNLLDKIFNKKTSSKEEVKEVIEENEDNKDNDNDNEEEDEVITIKDAKGNIFRIRFVRSFTAKCIQLSDEGKRYYDELKNEALSYSNTSSRMSWPHESINNKRNPFVKFGVRGKTLCVYYPLNALDYTDTKYKVEVVQSKRYEDVPCMYRIKNERRLEYAKELMALVADNLSLKKTERQAVSYYLPYEANEPLIERGLIKELKVQINNNDEILLIEE